MKSIIIINKRITYLCSLNYGIISFFQLPGSELIRGGSTRLIFLRSSLFCCLVPSANSILSLLWTHSRLHLIPAANRLGPVKLPESPVSLNSFASRDSALLPCFLVYFYGPTDQPHTKVPFCELHAPLDSAPFFLTHRPDI